MECLHTLVGGCCLALFGISSTVPVIQAHGFVHRSSARLAQSVERKALNIVVVDSSPTVGEFSGGVVISPVPARLFAQCCNKAGPEMSDFWGRLTTFRFGDLLAFVRTPQAYYKRRLLRYSS